LKCTAVIYSVGLITQRSKVQILPPQPTLLITYGRSPESARCISPRISPNSPDRGLLRNPLQPEWLVSYDLFIARVAPVSDWAIRRPVGPQTHWANVTASPGGIQSFQDSTTLRSAKFSSICTPTGCAEGARFRGVRKMSNTERNSIISLSLPKTSSAAVRGQPE
jgi:hypothetical protein